LARRLADRAHVHVERQHRIQQALLGVLRDAVVPRDALFGIGRVRELGFADANELLPLAARLIERLEDLAYLRLLHARLEQSLERAHRIGVLRSSADHLAVSRDGLIEVTELGLVDLTQAMLEFEDLVGALADVGLAAQHFGELRPALRLREQAIE
jgi:hypothetical protein